MGHFNDELQSLLDELLPVRSFVRRPRQSDPWFDKECRDAKRVTRRLERASAATHRRAAAASSDVAATTVAQAAAAKAAWYDQRRNYRKLRHQKSSAFWREKVEVNRTNPRRLWSTVDTMLGRGHTPASSAVDVETFRRFFSRTKSLKRASVPKAPLLLRLVACEPARRLTPSKR